MIKGISGGERVERRATVASIRKPEGAILLDLAADRPQPLLLNKTAASIWDVVSEDAVTPDDIVERLAIDFGLETALIEADVHEVLRGLLLAGCLDIAESP